MEYVCGYGSSIGDFNDTYGWVIVSNEIRPYPLGWLKEWSDMALDKAPVSIKASTGKVKWVDRKKGRCEAYQKEQI